MSAVDATTEVCEKREGSLVGGVYEKAPPTGKAHGTQEIQDSDKVKQSTTEDSSDGKKKRKSRKAVSEKKVTSKMRTSGSKSKLAKLEAELATQEPEPTFMLEGIVDEGLIYWTLRTWKNWNILMIAKKWRRAKRCSISDLKRYNLLQTVSICIYCISSMDPLHSF